MRTHAPGVYAVGDLVSTPQLAACWLRGEGILVIKEILGETAIPADDEKVPWCIYCHPEVAFAGLTEDEARSRGLDVAVQRDPFGGNGRARILARLTAS